MKTQITIQEVDIHGQKKSKLSRLKPIDWGEGTERASEEVDKIIYGE